MARFRSVATRADAVPAPTKASWRLSFLLLAALVAAGCSPAAVRNEPSSRTPTTSTAPGASKGAGKGDPAKATGGSHPSGGGTATEPSSTAASQTAAIESAWANSKRQFYEAALHDEPDYTPFLSTLVPGGAVYTHSVAYLTGLVSEGLVGPSTWRVGNERVVSQTSTEAHVEGCLWDTGSLWKASHEPAPAALGGGSGFAASHALLVLDNGKWLVLDDSVTTVKSDKEPGPCHGF
ncbi:MAG: hypothetical protein ACRD0Z_06090 [Acidimicrobiales bacterium]